MKKNIQLLLFVLIAGFCLAGCGDDVEEITSDPVPVFDPDVVVATTWRRSPRILFLFLIQMAQ